MVKSAAASSAGRQSGARSKRAQAVFDAATEVFLEFGYDRASVGAIAKRAGASKETIYSHFGSKEELFGAIVADVCEKYLRPLEMPDLHDRPPEAVLYALGREIVTTLSAPSTVALYRVVIAEAERYPNLATTFWEKGANAACDALGAYLAGQVAKGTLAIDEPRLAAEQFIMMARSTIILRTLLGVFEGSYDRAIEQSVRQAVRIFLDGCRHP